MSERARAGHRIGARLDALVADNEPALIIYLTAGDPSFDESAELVLAAADSGADLIELGVPFSDPSADGPVIQRAMERALCDGGAGAFSRTLEVVRRVRRVSEIPVCLFGYYNPIYQRGLQRAIDEAKAAGADGFLVVDLPAEESGELDRHLIRAGLCRVPLLSPTSSLDRARGIVAGAAVTGFVYYVALTGVTGAAHVDLDAVSERVRALRPALGGRPLAVGFGIRDAVSARRVAAVADAVVVGSALVDAVAHAEDAAARLEAVRGLCRELKDAVVDRSGRTGG
jgi:tryptophan synthase alpha chain